MAWRVGSSAIAAGRRGRKADGDKWVGRTVVMGSAASWLQACGRLWTCWSCGGWRRIEGQGRRDRRPFGVQRRRELLWTCWPLDLEGRRRRTPAIAAVGVMDGFDSHCRTEMGKMELLITLPLLDLEGIRTDRRHHAFARIRSCNQMFAGASIAGSHGCRS
ncbi:hypothetical protein ACLOJK_030157 [Asimina triloba]